jgi:hypothetical protein
MLLHYLFQKINSLANLKRTEYGKVNLDYVLGIGGFDLERYIFVLVSYFSIVLGKGNY